MLLVIDIEMNPCTAMLQTNKKYNDQMLHNIYIYSVSHKLTWIFKEKWISLTIEKSVMAVRICQYVLQSLLVRL